MFASAAGYGDKMGILDGIKGLWGRKSVDAYDQEDDGDYAYDNYSDQDYYPPDEQDGVYTPNYAEARSDSDRQDYYGEADGPDFTTNPPEPGVSLGMTRKRSNYTIDEHPPLISLSDVRSQELPALGTKRSRASAPERAIGGRRITSNRSGQRSSAVRGSIPSDFKNSLPFVTPSSDEAHTDSVYAAAGSDFRRQTDATAPSLAGDADTYSTQNTADPLLRRHSLSNTGDFALTSPAYYASRSGVGHLRPANQPRRQRQREVAILRPTSYDDAARISEQLKAGNAVCLVLINTPADLARRILDFAFGATAALDGQVSSPANKVYAATREYALTDAELQSLHEKGVV